MAKKATRKKAKSKAKRKPVAKMRRRKAAKRKPLPKQVAADVKAAHGALRQWTNAEIEEAFRRFQAANPEPKGELQAHQPVHAAGRGRAQRAGDRCRGQQGDAQPCSPRGKDAPSRWSRRARRGRPSSNHIKTIGLFNSKAKNVIALSSKTADRRARRRSARRSRGACAPLPGVGRKTPANVVLNCAFGEATSRSTPTYSASATAPALATAESDQVEPKLEQGVPAPSGSTPTTGSSCSAAIRVWRASRSARNASSPIYAGGR